MDSQTMWTTLFVIVTFGIYIGIAIWSRAGSTGEFYIAGKGVHPVANGLATAADWMSAASFLSMAGLISFGGHFGAKFLMGWTGGYVLLALLLAPYLRKFGKFTVPDFVADRYYSQPARVVALICAIFISFTYIVGQMGGVALVFSMYLNVGKTTGMVIGMGIVFVYAVLGGMKGITYTQVAQYCVLIFAFTVPALFISFQMTGHVLPQLGFGAELIEHPGTTLLDRLDGLNEKLGFAAYTDTGTRTQTIDMFCITAALMLGTAGLPHVIVRFFTVPSVKAARFSAGWALLFIAILYTTAPAVAAFARTNLIQSLDGVAYTKAPDWMKEYEQLGMVAWLDRNGDGIIQYRVGDLLEAGAKGPKFEADKVGEHGQRIVSNAAAATPIDPTQPVALTGKRIDNLDNELWVNRDIMVLANPTIAGLPEWVIALVAAGGLAAALSTAAGLLLVISTSISHDLLKRTMMPNITEKQELMFARIAAGAAVVISGLVGLNPPGFVGQVVALAFGLAASSFFPVIIMGIFWKRMNKEGAIAGMVVGILFTAGYIVFHKYPAVYGLFLADGVKPKLLFGISPEGIGTIGMLLNICVAVPVAMLTKAPPQKIQELVESIRVPRGSGDAQEH